MLEVSYAVAVFPLAKSFCTLPVWSKEYQATILLGGGTQAMISNTVPGPWVPPPLVVP